MCIHIRECLDQTAGLSGQAPTPPCLSGAENRRGFLWGLGLQFASSFLLTHLTKIKTYDIRVSVMCLFVASKLRANCYLRKYCSEIVLMTTFRKSAKMLRCFTPRDRASSERHAWDHSDPVKIMRFEFSWYPLDKGKQSPINLMDYIGNMRFLWYLMVYQF